ncbi:MAG: M15 family metallopeptidase [Peptococcaceae bacterium]|nr:M15 family metallopeptidase [Peptococcaceae bacterium]
MRCGSFVLALVLAALAALAVFSGGVPLTDTDFVNLKEYIPSLEIDLVYATENNFTGQRLYDNPTACLRKGTADKLKKAAEEVGSRGYRLKIWDAYRPPEAQVKMWNAFPNPNFVANPYRESSDHCRGCAVDLTLIDENGRELDMPSGFDHFGPKADRNYSDVSPVQEDNAKYLERVMLNHGFISIRTEWWHFADADRKKYDVAEKDPCQKLNGR